MQAMCKAHNLVLAQLKRYCLGIAVLLLPSISYAAIPDAATMLDNIEKQLPYLYSVVTGFAYVAGMMFIVKGLYSLREYGEGRMMGSAQRGIKEPLVLLLVGAFLLYIPTAKDVILTSVFGTASITPYNSYDTNTKTGFDELGQVLVNLVQFVGLVAFVRGLLILQRVGSNHGGQQATFGKAVTHLLGGALAMNIMGFVNIIATTLGID
jgi:intracellular multiplication protein IcmC